MRQTNRQHCASAVTGSQGQEPRDRFPASSLASASPGSHPRRNRGRIWFAPGASDAPSSTRCQPCSSPAQSTSQQGWVGPGAGAEGQQGSASTHSANPSKRQCWVAGSQTASSNHPKIETQRLIAPQESPVRHRRQVDQPLAGQLCRSLASFLLDTRRHPGTAWSADHETNILRHASAAGPPPGPQEPSPRRGRQPALARRSSVSACRYLGLSTFSRPLAGECLPRGSIGARASTHGFCRLGP